MSKTIKQIMLYNLSQKYRPGLSRHVAKRENGGQSPFIHSAATMDRYVQNVRRYYNWLADLGLKHCSIEVARAMVEKYINEYTNPSTQKTIRSALAKALDVSGPELCSTLTRHRKDYYRGRTLTQRAAAAARKHPDLVLIFQGCGLRKTREAKQVTAKNFFWGNKKRGQDPDRLYCRVKGKGGRWRVVLIRQGAATDAILQRIADRPTGQLFPEIPDHMNVHMYRADFAAWSYDYALSHGFRNGKQYHVRDGSGRCYDRGALDWVAAQLGHGPNRYVDIVYSYLSYGDPNRNP